MEIVPIDQIIESLQSERIKRIDPEIYSNGKGKTLEDLSRKLKVYKDQEIKNYVAGLMFYKLINSEQADPKDLQNIEYIEQIEEIISADEERRDQYYFHLDSILRKFILEVDNLRDLYRLARIAKKVATVPGLQEAYISIENQATLLYYDTLIKINENRKEEDAIDGTKYLKRFKKLGFDMSLIAEMLSNTVVSFIEDRNQMYFENNYEIGVNVQNDFKMIDYLIDSGIEEGECLKKLKNCEGILLRNEKKDYRIKDKLKDFTVFEIKLKVNLNNIQRVGEVNRIDSISGVTCVISLGKYGRDNVVIKEYFLNANSSEEIRKRIEIETKRYEFLAQKDKTDEQQKIFLKYYGSFTDIDRNSIMLVYERYGQTLFEYIEKYRKLGEEIDNRPLMKLIKDILNIFSELEEFKVYHQNINPLTVFIDTNQNIKVGEFYGAVANISEAIVDSMNRKIRDAYYWPEMVEESKQKVGKQDVFALGLVILQMARPVENQELRIGNTYEEVKSNLMQKIKDVGYGEWLVNLLKKMLNFDHSQRLRFKNLTEYVSEALSSTTSNLSISSHSSN